MLSVAWFEIDEIIKSGVVWFEIDDVIKPGGVHVSMRVNHRWVFNLLATDSRRAK